MASFLILQIIQRFIPVDRTYHRQFQPLETGNSLAIRMMSDAVMHRLAAYIIDGKDAVTEVSCAPNQLATWRFSSMRNSSLPFAISETFSSSSKPFSGKNRHLFEDNFYCR